MYVKLRATGNSWLDKTAVNNQPQPSLHEVPGDLRVEVQQKRSQLVQKFRDGEEFRATGSVYPHHCENRSKGLLRFNFGSALMKSPGVPVVLQTSAKLSGRSEQGFRRVGQRALHGRSPS